MTKISSHIGSERYRMEITSSSGNKLVADEPVYMGGTNAGFSPKELLASSLAACTSATLRMYADRKEWLLDSVDIDIELDWDDKNLKTVVQRRIRVHGELSEEQRKRLLAVANACPLHKILTGQFEIESTLD